MFRRLALACLGTLLCVSCTQQRTNFVDAAVTLGDSGFDAGTDAGPPRDAGEDLSDVLIYAHSRDTLFTFSPFTNTVTTIGPFREADGSAAEFMIDLAVDSDGEVFTSSDTALYRVNVDTAEVTLVGEFDLSGDELFALSFLPPGQSPDGTELLIGATNEGIIYSVDTDTAATAMLGAYPDGWRSSGDIVSVEELGTFATLRRDDFSSDVLAQILFAADGSATVSVIGPTRSPTEDYRQLFGLGYWGRNVYGFTNSGQLLRIDRMSGAAEVVSTSTGSDQFWGAGVTTTVPFLI